MNTVLFISQVIAALLLVFVIMIQDKGSGMGEAVGGTGGSGFETTKRGAEKVLARVTVVILTIFLVVSMALNFV